MSAPFLFILLPFLFSLAALSVSRWEKPLAAFGTVLPALLAWIAWNLPIGSPFNFGPWSPQIEPVMRIFGVGLRLGEGSRALLALVYGGVTLWSLAAHITRQEPRFILLQLVYISLLVGVLAVPGLVLAAVMILFSVLTGVVILTAEAPRATSVTGALGFMTFSTLAIPFLMMAAGLIPGLGGSPAELDAVLRPSIFLGLGFAFLLAVFPFYAWLPRLTEFNHPLRVAFVVGLMNIAVSVLGIVLVNSIVWLRESERLFAVLRFTGLLVVVTAGFWSAFQRDWGRQMGFSMLVENGLVLIALGSGLDTGIPLIGSLLLVRIPAYLVWGMGMALLREHSGSLDLAGLEGVGTRHPILGAATLAGHFSVVGFPLLAGFVPRISLIFTLGAVPEAIGIWAAMLGMAVGGLRTLSIVFLRPSKNVQAAETTGEDPLLQRFQQGLLVFGTLMLLVFGIFPQVYTAFVARFPLIFSQFAR